MKKVNVRTLGLIFGTLSYLLFGAAIFDMLESENEFEMRSQLDEAEHVLISKYNISSSDHAALRKILVLQVPYKSGVQWKFTGALYFVITVITTIGYGHSAPMTNLGRLFCMFYAFGGIPLSLVVYQAVGERLNTFMAWMLGHIKRRFGFGGDVSQWELVMSGGVACGIVLFGGAAIFMEYENWDYFESLYYCYITLTTIGFGDFVALQKDGDLQRRPHYIFISILYIMIALCVVASSLNLLVLRFLTMNTEDEKREAEEEQMRGFEEMLHTEQQRQSSPRRLSSVSSSVIDLNAAAAARNLSLQNQQRGSQGWAENGSDEGEQDRQQVVQPGPLRPVPYTNGPSSLPASAPVEGSANSQSSAQRLFQQQLQQPTYHHNYPLYHGSNPYRRQRTSTASSGATSSVFEESEEDENTVEGRGNPPLGTSALKTQPNSHSAKMCPGARAFLQRSTAPPRPQHYSAPTSGSTGTKDVIELSTMSRSLSRDQEPPIGSAIPRTTSLPVSISSTIPAVAQSTSEAHHTTTRGLNSHPPFESGGCKPQPSPPSVTATDSATMNHRAFSLETTGHYQHDDSTQPFSFC